MSVHVAHCCHDQPMTRTSKLVATGVLLLALAGCGSSTAKAAAAPKPSPTPSTASITQYASALNGPLKSFSDQWTTYKNDCIIGQEQLECGIGPIGLHATASTVMLTLENAYTKTSQVYVGPPPAELQSLVEETHGAASQVASDTEDADKPTDSLYSDAQDLMSDIDKWGPYLS